MIDVKTLRLIITGIIILEAIALLKGVNGILLTTVIGLLAGLTGLVMPQWKIRNGTQKSRKKN